MQRLTLSFLLVHTLSANAQVTNPIRYTWIAEACASWNCAAAALVLANGKPNVIVLPTRVDKYPWLVLRRVEEGSFFVPDDAPFRCEVFEATSSAFSRFAAMDHCHAPLILNVPDGRIVVTSLQKCNIVKRRVIR